MNGQLVSLVPSEVEGRRHGVITYAPRLRSGRAGWVWHDGVERQPKLGDRSTGKPRSSLRHAAMALAPMLPQRLRISVLFLRREVRALNRTWRGKTGDQRPVLPDGGAVRACDARCWRRVLAHGSVREAWRKGSNRGACRPSLVHALHLLGMTRQGDEAPSKWKAGAEIAGRVGSPTPYELSEVAPKHGRRQSATGNKDEVSGAA